MGTLTTVAKTLIDAHPRDAARVIARMDGDDAAVVLSAASIGGAAAVLVRMPPRAVVDCLAALPPTTARNILESLSASVAAGLLRNASRGLRQTILEGALNRERVEDFLQYPVMSVGDAMDSDAPSVPAHWSASETLGQWPHLAKSSCPYLYVTNPESELVGVVRLEDLDRVGDRAIDHVMAAPVTTLSAGSPIASVHDDPAWKEYDVLPVVGRRNLLVGILRHKDIRRHGHGKGGALEGDGSIAEAVLSLGELYWEGLWKVVDSLAPVSERANETDADQGRDRR